MRYGFPASTSHFYLHISLVVWPVDMRYVCNTKRVKVKAINPIEIISRGIDKGYRAIVFPKLFVSLKITNREIAIEQNICPFKQNKNPKKKR